MESYVALMIDLKKSRSYSQEDRNMIQDYIFNTILTLNRVFERRMIRDVEFSAGDEVQGLFNSLEAAYLYFRFFNMLVYPVQVRAGIGVGEWSVQISQASTTAQDGSAYHNARRAIEAVKENSEYTLLIHSGGECDVFINAAIQSSIILTKNYSEYQNELMLLAELWYPIDFQEIININKLPLLFPLLEKKVTLGYYTYYSNKKSKIIGKIAHDFQAAYQYMPTPIDALDEDTTFFVTRGKQRGMATALADFLGISRQSVDKTLKSANIYETRNATIVTLKLIDNYKRGRNDNLYTANLPYNR